MLTSLEGEQASAASEHTQAQIPALGGLRRTDRACAGGIARTAAGSIPVAHWRTPNEQALIPPADTWRQRPNVVAAEDEVSAAMALVYGADAARRPGFGLVGSLELNAASLDAPGSREVARTIGASMSGPPFDAAAGAPSFARSSRRWSKHDWRMATPSLLR